MNKLLEIYDKQYLKLMIFSFAMLLLAIGYLGFHWMSTGEFVAKGISLKGGLIITAPVSGNINIQELEQVFTNAFPRSDLGIRDLSELGQQASIVVESSDLTEEQIVSTLNNNGFSLKQGDYAAEFIGSDLGKSFYQQTIIAMIVAFILMSIVVFITFRNLLPSSFVILCAVSDLLTTLAVISFFDVKLTTAGIAAFLMLVGYSVDTDILLTTKVLKRKEKGSIFERTVNAAGTGLTMTLTALAAVTAAYFVSQSDTIQQISLILMIGMIFDIVYTWIQNAGILRYYLEKKEKRHSQ